MFAAALALGAVAVAAVVAILGLVAVAELSDLQRAVGQRPIRIVGFAAVLSTIALAYRFGERAPEMFPVAVAGAFVLVCATLVVQRRVDGATISVAASILGVTSVAVLAGYLVVVRRVPSGTELLFALVLFAVVNDVAMAVVSRIRGGRGWLDVAAGTAATLIAGAIVGAAMSPPFDRTSAIVLAGVVAVAVPIGRLAVAMLRGEAARPISSIGVLGRLDGLLIAAPLFFYAWRALAR